jgi:hypothetical protein
MKKQYIFLVFCAAIVFIACNSNQTDSNSQDVVITEGVANEDSEMTLLMREMYDNFSIVKDSIVAGQNIDRSLFNEVHRIHRAAPTDVTIMGPTFEGLATIFIDRVDSLLLAEDNKQMYFNITIQACVGCHQEFCPGPLDKINRLVINPKQEQQ